MDHLDRLEAKAIYIIREAYARDRRLALLWSIGKDSTALLWMVRKAFLGDVPFPVVHIDTGYKFEEIYEFRARYAYEWGLPLTCISNAGNVAACVGPDKVTKMECCTELKTEALKKWVRKSDIKALLLGIRRDEHGIRAKERYFSPRDEDFNWDYRNQPAELWDQFSQRDDDHMRVHPLLHMTELDIWRYTQREGIPIVSLYLAKNGKRYRSIGCEPCCNPVDSQADTVDKIIAELQTTTEAERSGRAQDKEDAYTMQKLRALGYM